ncbi:MAG: peptidoglycan-binding protein [Candidatus Omnitrophica bacterium]|nr:peptidoglycan-binding protein [Candidatus Omnitrophota bacterium]
MNTLKASAVVALSLVVLSGCGQKKEEYPALPPEQILSGNAILAPQSVTLEAHSIAAPVNATAVTPSAPTDTATMELSVPVTDKPTNKDIQQALKNAGVYSGPVDGSLGPKSKKAIREFQTNNGLNADGKVGPRTWKKLATYLQSAPAAEPVDAAPISN